MSKRVGAASIFLLILVSGLVLGGSDSATTTVSWTVLPFARLTIAGKGATGENVSSRFGLLQPSDADAERGYRDVDRAVTLIAESNVNWRLAVRTDDPNLGRSYDGSYIKPLSDFQLRVAGGEYRGPSNRAQILTSGTNGRYELGIDYRVLFDGERYRPGDYQVTLVYTITTD